MLMVCIRVPLGPSTYHEHIMSLPKEMFFSKEVTALDVRCITTHCARSGVMHGSENRETLPEQ